jgi:tRNA dimethylallyltransferase
LRRRLAERAAAGEDLIETLRACDPATAERLHPQDTKRIVRALEVWELSGKPISQWQAEAAWTQPAGGARVFALAWPRDQLHRRIEERVERMFAAGLVAEVRGLTAAGTLSRTAAEAVGYREVLLHLRGELHLPATIELVKTRTRQFAKRQETWFRSLAECRRVEVSEPLDAVDVAERILAAARGTGVV